MKILLRTFNWNTNMKSWQLIGRRKLNCSQQLRGSQGNLEHQSYAVVSDEMSHDKSRVYSFNPAILEEMKKITEAKQVHYWSDGTTSQFKNSNWLSYWDHCYCNWFTAVVAPLPIKHLLFIVQW